VFIILPGAIVSSLLLTCQIKSSAEKTYLPALRSGGWNGDIELVNAEDPAPSLEGVAGLLLCGGRDIHPRHWDEQEPVHPAAHLDEARDELEIPLVREAWRLGLPILGICRGVQILNVALGGSLIQDIPSQCGLDPGRHGQENLEGAHPGHPVLVAPGSRLAGLMGGPTASVNSYHHQSVGRVAPCLRAVAWCCEPGPGADLVEAIEAADRWVLGVQWHPETLVDRDQASGAAARGLFRGFAGALGPR